MSLNILRSRLALAVAGASVGVLAFAVTLLPQINSTKALESPLLWTALIAQVVVTLTWIVWSGAPRRLLVAIAFIELALVVIWYIGAPGNAGQSPTGALLSTGGFALSAVAIAALLFAVAAVVHPGRPRITAPAPSAPAAASVAAPAVEDGAETS